MEHAASQELYAWREERGTSPAPKAEIDQRSGASCASPCSAYAAFPMCKAARKSTSRNWRARWPNSDAMWRRSFAAATWPKDGGGLARIRISRIWAPRVTGLEAFVHTFLGVLRAAFSRPDILHIHAIGPAFFTPLARALGLRVVVTHHVLNYENEKWGPIARFVLRLGEWAGMAFANGRIAVSEGLAKQMAADLWGARQRYPKRHRQAAEVQSTATLQAFGLAANRYALTVARIDEQKRQLDLIAAYARLREPEMEACARGRSRSFRKLCPRRSRSRTQNSRCRHAWAPDRRAPGRTVHPCPRVCSAVQPRRPADRSTRSGELRPPASYSSNIPAHREIALSRARYFEVGDIASLTEQLASLFAAPAIEKFDAAERARLTARHDWHNIAQRTLAVYFDALSGAKSGGLADDPSARKMRELS